MLPQKLQEPPQLLTLIKNGLSKLLRLGSSCHDTTHLFVKALKSDNKLFKTLPATFILERKKVIAARAPIDMYSGYGSVPNVVLYVEGNFNKCKR